MTGGRAQDNRAAAAYDPRVQVSAGWGREMSEPVRAASRADQRHARHRKQLLRLAIASAIVVLAGGAALGTLQLTSSDAPSNSSSTESHDTTAKTPEGVLAGSHEIDIPTTTTPESLDAAEKMNRPRAQPGDPIWCQMNNSPQPECPAP